MMNFPPTANEYYKLPDLYHFGDYQKCIGSSTDSSSPAYCIVNSFIKPDNESELYNHIREFSKRTKQHYRHDKLERGICLADCAKLVEELGDEAGDYFVESFPMDSRLTFDFIGYRFVDEDRLSFNRIINICVNKKLMNNNNLKAFSSIEYCVRRDHRVPIGRQ